MILSLSSIGNCIVHLNKSKLFRNYKFFHSNVLLINSLMNAKSMVKDIMKKNEIKPRKRRPGGLKDYIESIRNKN